MVSFGAPLLVFLCNLHLPIKKKKLCQWYQKGMSHKPMFFFSFCFQFIFCFFLFISLQQIGKEAYVCNNHSFDRNMETFFRKTQPYRVEKALVLVTT